VHWARTTISAGAPWARARAARRLRLWRCRRRSPPGGSPRRRRPPGRRRRSPSRRWTPPHGWPCGRPGPRARRARRAARRPTGAKVLAGHALGTARAGMTTEVQVNGRPFQGRRRSRERGAAGDARSHSTRWAVHPADGCGIGVGGGHAGTDPVGGPLPGLLRRRGRGLRQRGGRRVRCGRRCAGGGVNGGAFTRLRGGGESSRVGVRCDGTGLGGGLELGLLRRRGRALRRRGSRRAGCGRRCAGAASTAGCSLRLTGCGHPVGGGQAGTGPGESLLPGLLRRVDVSLATRKRRWGAQAMRRERVNGAGRSPRLRGGAQGGWVGGS